MFGAWPAENRVRRLTEAGCSANVIASIAGHSSMREVQKYTAAAD
jgi:hypothetical protein